MRAIHQGICWVRVDWIERDLVFLHALVVERGMIVQMPANFGARRKPLLGEVMVPEIRLIFLQLVLLNEGAEVVELLRVVPQRPLQDRAIQLDRSAGAAS